MGSSPGAFPPSTTVVPRDISHVTNFILIHRNRLPQGFLMLGKAHLLQSSELLYSVFSYGFVLLNDLLLVLGAELLIAEVPKHIDAVHLLEG